LEICQALVDISDCIRNLGSEWVASDGADAAAGGNQILVWHVDLDPP
jgi:hypothetical protein